MSDKIIQFNTQQEEPHSCETCDLVWEFLEYAKQAESNEELFEILSALVDEAKVIGQKELLVAQLNQNLEILDQLDGFGCDCEECCENEE